MSRPNRDKVFLTVAANIGSLGTCDRAHVGAVIVRDGRCISWGYNGAPPGAPHCDENHHGYGSASAYNQAVTDGSGCRNVTHAEANALAFAARQGISTDDATMYVERTPCLTCARLIIAAGIKQVMIAERYRDLAGEVALVKSFISVVYPFEEA